MSRFKLSCAALVCLFLSAPAMADEAHESNPDCYVTAPDGTCIDDPSTIPGTGQFGSPGGASNMETPVTDRGNLETPEDIGAKQHHANVVLTEDTFVYAHDICRWVGNATTRGMSLFIGLETKPEWVSFLSQPPVGADIALCCKKVTVNRCGEAVTLPFAKAGGPAVSVTRGYDARFTFRCVAGAEGVGATHGGAPSGVADSSWAELTTGNCDAPDDEEDDEDGTGVGGGQGGNDGDGGGGESRDGNGDGRGDGASSGDPAKGNDGGCSGGRCG